MKHRNAFAAFTDNMKQNKVLLIVHVGKAQLMPRNIKNAAAAPLRNFKKVEIESSVGTVRSCHVSLLRLMALLA